MWAARNPNDEMDTIIPHECLGADRCGCIVSVVRGHEADMVCNECNALIGTVPANEVEEMLLQLAPSDEICGSECLHCGALNVFPGFSTIEAFTCRQCGEGTAIERSGQ
jgi:ribosomal protein L40E